MKSQGLETKYVAPSVAAKIKGCDRKTVSAACAAGELPGIQYQAFADGRTGWIVDRDDLAEWIPRKRGRQTKA